MVTFNVDITELHLIVLAVIEMLQIVIISWLIGFRQDMKRNAPEAVVFKDARDRKKLKNVLAVVDGASRWHFVPGTKESDSRPEYDYKKFGVKIDASLSQYMPDDKLADGTPIHIYHTNLALPAGARGAIALVQLIAHIRKTYPELDYISDDFALIIPFDANSTDLEATCREIVRKYAYDLVETEYEIEDEDEEYELYEEEEEPDDVDEGVGDDNDE